MVQRGVEGRGAFFTKHQKYPWKHNSFRVTKGKPFKGLIEVELEGVKVDATRAWVLKGLMSNLRNYAQPILEDIKIGRELIPLPRVQLIAF